jgi:hypothetical protein
MSFYYKRGSIEKHLWGENKCATLYIGQTANLEEIIAAEVLGKDIKRVEGTQQKRGKVLIIGKKPSTNYKC